MTIKFITKSGNPCELEIQFGDGRASTRAGFKEEESEADVMEAKSLSDVIVGHIMGNYLMAPPLKGSDEETEQWSEQWLGKKQ